MALGLITAATLLNTVAHSRHTSWNGGCGDDGANYCAMSTGLKTFRPWSRRVLMPLTVRALTNHHPERVRNTFLVLSLASLAALASGSCVLTARISSRSGAPKGEARAAGAVAGLLLLLMPMGFRWAWFYPVLVDHFATMFAVLWLLTSSSHSNRVRWTSVPLAACAVLARESWALVLPAGIAAQVVLERQSARARVAAATVAAISAGAVIAYTAPGQANPATDDVFRYTTGFLRHYLTSGAGFEHLVWMVLFSLGAIPFLLLVRPAAFKQLTLDDSRCMPPLILPCLTVVLMIVATALVGGADVHRFVFSAAPFLLPVILTLVARESLEAELAIATVTSLLIWRVWHVMDGSRAGYLRFFSPVYLSRHANFERLMSDLTFVVSGLLVWAMLVWARPAVRSHRARRIGPERSR